MLTRCKVRSCRSTAVFPLLACRGHRAYAQWYDERTLHVFVP